MSCSVLLPSNTKVSFSASFVSSKHGNKQKGDNCMWCSVLQFREQTGQNKSYIKIKYATRSHRSVEPTCTYSHTVSKHFFSFFKLQQWNFPVRVYLSLEKNKSAFHCVAPWRVLSTYHTLNISVVRLIKTLWPRYLLFGTMKSPDFLYLSLHRHPFFMEEQRDTVQT